jgi:acetamidase/formamidase
VEEERHPEAAFATLWEGIGRRELLLAATAIGAGAIAPGWTLSPGVEDALAAAADGPGPRVLQSGGGRRAGHYVTSTPRTVRWGSLPNRDANPIRVVRSGALVTFDTVSHEGILEDQGRDPMEYFTRHGVREHDVLRDARAIAGSAIEHDFVNDGPHVVTGPIHVIGAAPGDVLCITVVGLVPRAPYGVISNRHGLGALPGQYPRTPSPSPGASAARPELYHNVSVFTPVRRIRNRDRGVLPVSRRLRAEFPIDPFMGIMGVALDTSETVNSIPPTPAGGNLDIRDLTVGSKLFLPVFVPGAKFFVGDPHYRQGDGEVALTAMEAPLRGTFRLTLLKRGSRAIPGRRGRLDMPFGETADYWLPVGLDADLDEAMKQAVREAIEFLHGELGMSRAVAYAYMSAATDYVVSQVVDKTKGVHARIVKSHFVERRRAVRRN